MSRLMIYAVLFCLCLCGSALALANAKPKYSTAPMQTASEAAVTVTATGVNPSSGSQSAGPITLRVVNQTGEAELAVQFYDSKGLLLREVSITQGQTEWSETFELEAGTYTLVAGHKPEWKYSLTVQ